MKIAVHLINLAVMEHVVKVGNIVQTACVKSAMERCATEHAVVGISLVQTSLLSVMYAIPVASVPRIVACFASDFVSSAKPFIALPL